MPPPNRSAAKAAKSSSAANNDDVASTNTILLSLVGRYLAKYFDGYGTFVGVVASVDTARSVAMIEYEDGDSEEMFLEQMLEYLLPEDYCPSPSDETSASWPPPVGSRKLVLNQERRRRAPLRLEEEVMINELLRQFTGTKGARSHRDEAARSAQGSKGRQKTNTKTKQQKKNNHMESSADETTLRSVGPSSEKGKAASAAAAAPLSRISSRLDAEQNTSSESVQLEIVLQDRTRVVMATKNSVHVHGVVYYYSPQPWSLEQAETTVALDPKWRIFAVADPQDAQASILVRLQSRDFGFSETQNAKRQRQEVATAMWESWRDTTEAKRWLKTQRKLVSNTMPVTATTASARGPSKKALGAAQDGEQELPSTKRRKTATKSKQKPKAKLKAERKTHSNSAVSAQSSSKQQSSSPQRSARQLGRFSSHESLEDQGQTVVIKTGRAATSRQHSSENRRIDDASHQRPPFSLASSESQSDEDDVAVQEPAKRWTGATTTMLASVLRNKLGPLLVNGHNHGAATNGNGALSTSSLECNEDEELNVCYRAAKAQHDVTCGADGRYGITGHVTRGSMMAMMDYLREQCHLDETAKFIDLGHGMGRPVLHAASLVPHISLAVGTEHNPDLYNQSMVVLRNVVDELPCHEARPRIFFMDANIRDLTSLNPFTHVYVFNIGMPDDLIDHIVHLIRKSKSVQYVVLYPHRMLTVARIGREVGDILHAMSMSMPSGCSYEGLITRVRRLSRGSSVSPSRSSHESPAASSPSSMPQDDMGITDKGRARNARVQARPWIQPSEETEEVDEDIQNAQSIVESTALYRAYVDQLGTVAELEQEKELFRTRRSQRRHKLNKSFLAQSPWLPKIPLGFLRRLAVRLGVNPSGDKLDLLASISDYCPDTFSLSMCGVGDPYDSKDVDRVYNKLLAKPPSRRCPES